MNNLKQKLTEEMKTAMKSGNQVMLGVVRMLISSIKNKEIEKGEVKDEDVLAIISSEAKKRKDSILAFEKGGRQDLADKEKVELEILQSYLPKQMSEAEVEKAIDEIMQKSGLKEFGPLMKIVSQELKGKADGKMVAEVVKRKLS